MTKMAKKKLSVIIGGDHKAYKLKEQLVSYIRSLGYEVYNTGCFTEERTDYPVWASIVALRTSKKDYDRGIVICSTGVGVSIVANKYPGVRAALVVDEKVAEKTRKHNDTNVLALAAGSTPQRKAKKIVKTWLDTKYEGGRHQKRLDLISKIEKENMK